MLPILAIGIVSDTYFKDITFANNLTLFTKKIRPLERDLIFKKFYFIIY